MTKLKQLKKESDNLILDCIDGKPSTGTKMRELIEKAFKEGKKEGKETEQHKMYIIDSSKFRMKSKQP